jgi:hypothetical protein
MRSLIFTMLLCLALVTSGASAMGLPSTGDRGPAKSGLVDLVWAFLQDLFGPQIDPWGATDGSDLGPEIDPWGDEENTTRPEGAAGSDVGMEIDPWG